MTKYMSCMLGAAAAALLSAGAARAQDYGGYDDGRYDRYYDSNSGETVIVHPYAYDRIEKRQVIGRVNGEVNPTQYSLSRPVDFSDLDLRRGEDYIELRERVADTARDLCAELEDRVPDLRGDSSAARECVRDATRNAMRDIRERLG